MNDEQLARLRAIGFDPELGLFECFVKVRNIVPDCAALFSGDRSLTYAEVSHAAEAIAARLISTGVRRGDRVAIVANRSIEATLAMLGVARAGGVYAPLDPSYDAERLETIIEDLEPQAILWSGAFSRVAQGLAGDATPALHIDACADAPVSDLASFPAVNGADPVYVMYTSGSTGRPKGVIIPHRAVARLGFDQPGGRVLPGDVMLHSSTIAADGSVLEIWPSLITGGAVAIVDGPTPALDKIAEAIRLHKPNVAALYCGVFHLLVEHEIDAFAGMRMVIIGGDVLSPALIGKLTRAYPDLTLCNAYGPAENTVVSTFHEIATADLNGAPLPIGVPAAHSECFIVDEALGELDDNEIGQLVVGGYGVGLGYLKRPDQTAERFIEDPRAGRGGRVYLTGDMVRRRSDGVYEFFGRRDRQVKIGGRRIELDEIEHVMRRLPMLADVAVDVIETETGDSRIAAFLRPNGPQPGDEQPFVRETLDALRGELPEGMMPRAFHVVAEFPLTENHKVDRKALVRRFAAAGNNKPGVTPVVRRAPQTASETADLIAEIWDGILHCGPLDGDSTFFEAGGTSLQLIKAHAELEKRLGVQFDITVLFETPRLRELAETLSQLAPISDGQSIAQAKAQSGNAEAPDVDLPDNAIAIVGMAGRFPGADSVADFWCRLRDGENLIQRFDQEELEDSFTPEQRAADNYVPARPWLRDVDKFDAKFFGMYAREADVTDPQARIFLEVCYEALEDCGHDPDRMSGSVGVFAGCSLSTYVINNVLSDRAKAEDFAMNYQVGNFNEVTGNLNDSLATRVAYKLNLKGPAFTVQTACSTSLTAMAQAVTNLRSGQCDYALAGGVSITFPQKRGYFCLEGGMASPDGVCRPFDAEAGGTVFGHGAGVVVLRRLKDAVADGDQIYAVIRGVGVNNDGSDKIAYAAPSVRGQADAIRTGQRDAGVDPETVSYVECHGTATPLGDPIELRALSQAFGRGDGPETCALGAVKGNIGHLDAAAGVMGVIKTAMMLTACEIPPVANFRVLNPKIDLADTPFRIPTKNEPWQSDGARRAGVSAFGVGGTNVHIVLEEAPAPRPAEPDQKAHILPLSAKTPEALSDMQARLADALEVEGAPALADAAITLQEGRTEYTYRSVVAARTVAEAAAALRKAAPARSAVSDDAPAVAFMFPGQGSQYPGMGSGLYKTEPEFARWIDRGADILVSIIGCDIRELLCRSDAADESAARTLRETRVAQPALFLTQFACARLWLSRGVHPSAMVGHSIGEFAAASLSGVMDFETALKTVAARGRLMQECPAGTMLSVRASLSELEQHLDGSVDIAARNAPKLNVLSGQHDAIERLAATLKAEGFACTELHTSHAFHSSMMNPVCEALTKELAGTDLRAPQIPYVSCVTGDWITGAQATDPAYWARQAREAVNFADAVKTLAAREPTLLIETGAGRTLSAFASQTLSRDAYAGVVQSLPDHGRAVSDDVAMAAAFGQLWCAGVNVDWSVVRGRGGRRTSLPTYPFQRKRHWVDAQAADSKTATELKAEAASPAGAATATYIQESKVMPSDTEQTGADRKTRLTGELLALLAELSGEDISPEDVDVTFLELGFDSLFLGQVTQRLLKDYGADVTFRQLLSEIPTPTALAAHLDGMMPADAAPAPAVETPAASMTPSVPAGSPPAVTAASGAQATSSVADLIQQQMQTMQAVFAQQLAALGAQATPATPAAPAAATPRQSNQTQSADVRTTNDKPARRAFSVGRATNASGGDLTAEQLAYVKDLSERYGEKFPKSKAYVEKYRPLMADPRTAAGFRAEWKDMVFPVVAERSKGSRIWDIDGNEYIDCVNGFGQTAFGHSPDFVIDAVNRQMERGFAIGPQCDLAGPVAERFAKMVGHERVTFCNTGSEAVMAAMRLARAVTGRETIVVFGNDYHGQFDEVLVKGKARGGGDPIALPIAPGIPRSGLANMKVLPYGAPESLDWIRANGEDIAAVIVEPVQSRHPELRPAEFVRSVRSLTKASGAALVMDEVVTGFRVGPRGMQGEWDVQGDMATYGKVVAGGMPVGMLAGSCKFMDALDGGVWRFGDDSVPQTSPTFFAGTFVRHPLVLAALDATLDHIERHGADLWDRTAKRTSALAEEMNSFLESRGLPRLVETYSSWLVLNLTDHDANAALVFPLMRMRGVHVQVGYMCIFTTAHTDEDFETVAQAFKDSVDELRGVGILSTGGAAQLDTVNAEVSVADVAATAPLEPAPTKDIPLTEAQREIWMTSQLGDDASCSFNESVSLRMRGGLDIAALERALNRVIARHDGLRQRFARNGETFDILAPFNIELRVHDLVGEVDPESVFRSLLVEDSATPIDLVVGPPLWAFIAKLAADSHVLVVNAHHIVCDGWSYNVVFNDLAAFYTEETGGAIADLEPAPSFAAYAMSVADKPVRSEVTDFWRAQFAEVPELPELPSDHARPAIKSYAGATCTAHISGDVLRAARKAGAKQGCTLFATLFSALQIVIGRLSNADDVVIGVPTGGQALLPNSAMVGHCVNFLPIRAKFERKGAVADHLKHVSAQVMNAFDHQDYTYGTLVRALDIERSLNRLPLTEIQFNLEKLADNLKMSDLDASAEPNPKTAVNFDLFFNIIERRDGLRVDVDYNTALYDAETVQRWIGHLETVLSEIARDVDRPIDRLPLMTPAQTVWLADATNRTAAVYPREKLLHELVAESAARDPNRVAAEDQDGEATYADLNQRANAIAAHIQSLIPEAGGRVAVAMHRSIDCLAAMIGVMKAGHAYVPLDPTQPAARLRGVLDASKACALIHDVGALPEFADRDNLATMSVTDAPAGGMPREVRRGDDPSAYVIFTSGSTGAPKGVEICHRCVVNFLCSMAREPGFTANDVMLAVTTTTFDISVLELFLPLMQGGKVVIASREDVLDGFRLVERAARGDITHLQATPTLWAMLLEAGFSPNRNLSMLCGGEPMPADLAQALTVGGGPLWNLYGPTETTIWSSIAKIESGAKITIGRPIANTTLHILDAADGLTPIGAVGELNIGGDGLAKGYFGRPDLTAQAFRDVEINGATQRLYRTGDLARRLADGTIDVLGRGDGQIKLRGFRIELGDVEAALRGLDGVEAAAVALRKSPRGGDQLVGYVIRNAAGGKQENYGARLASLLPDYMIPTAWVSLDELPQTSNGKLDRKALPAPENWSTVTAFHTKAKTSTEKKIAAIWEDVLGLADISTTDTLYSLGADSLTVFRIAARMIDAGMNLEARDLLQHPSIAELAAFADSRGDNDDKTKKPSLRAYRGGAMRKPRTD